jgi:hypothetical protein
MEQVFVDPEKWPKVLQLYLEISQYPILADRIRQRMREELFARGIVSKNEFEREVHEKAIESQRREGLLDPVVEEPDDVWQKRLNRTRDVLTDFYFAYNVPHEHFVRLVQDVLSDRVPAQDVILSFNPELAPWDLLFTQAAMYESYPPEKRAKVQHHLKEIIVVLIKSMISDQLGFVSLAKEYLTISDLREIRRRRIGRGKIGGKAAGLMLAWKILQATEPDAKFDIRQHLAIPESYFIGADVFYDFFSTNNMYDLLNQKYKTPEEFEAGYHRALELYSTARFPPNVERRLGELLDEIGNCPLIVRSSSLLEDNFGTSFAGKYDSIFCPNQGTRQENLEAVLNAIRRAYSCVVRPEVLIYRQRMGLIDYDERMAILLQKVEGERHGRYFFPTLAGVGFSRNPFRWNKRIRREDGFLRIVFGMGTRAVERVGNDYARMVALSHPQLRPEATPGEIRWYSQRYADVIDLETNRFCTVPISEVLSEEFPGAELLASLDRGDYFEPAHAVAGSSESSNLVLTYDGLLRNADFVTLLKTTLKRLETVYRRPVDIEFTVDVIPSWPKPQFRLHLLQCRPQSYDAGSEQVLPSGVPDEDKIFSVHRLVPQGLAQRIRYIVYVDPHRYYEIPDQSLKMELARLIGRINKALEGERFILMGPGRWGTSNIDLGVRVSYAEIYNTSVLIEIALSKGGEPAEVSYGTHFFQDLVEGHIYPLPLYPDDPRAIFRAEFFTQSPNVLTKLLPGEEKFESLVRVIDVPAVSGGRLLEVVMNSDEDEAFGYLRHYST